jgi:3-oxoacyl-[acyl-carrier-protein] synthase-3
MWAYRAPVADMRFLIEGVLDAPAAWAAIPAFEGLDADTAQQVLEQAARAVLAKAERTEADIDWLIPHQANIRIMQGTAKKLKLPLSKLIVTVDEHGNTSAASIPLALDHAVRSGRIQPGDTVMLEGVGGGFTWGAVLLDL